MADFNPLLNHSSLIHNDFVQGQGDLLQVLHKYSGQVLAQVQMIDEEQMEQAIESSEEGFLALKNMNTGERRECLQSLQRLMGEQADALAELISAEAGKPISYARVEVLRSLSTLDHSIDLCRTFSGEQIPMDFDNGLGKEAYTARFPLGPIAAISPFNFPLNLVMHKLAPALAVGCSVLLKPSPYTPLTALALADLVREAGFPEGSFNVIIAETQVAEKMIVDDRLKMLSFTGSPAIGWKLKSLSGKKKVILELGGDAAVLIDETVDLKNAAEAVAKGSFLYSGQICISTQRIFCVEEVYSEFKSHLIKSIDQVKVGDPMDSEVEVSSLIDRIHLERISSWVEEAESLGADCLVGGEIESLENNIFQPTLMENVPRGCRLGAEEVFGPVAILEKVKSFDGGLRRINESDFGLQAGIFTERIDRMKKAFKHLEVGGVMVGMIPGFRIDHMPYGGVKNSGLGREGIKYAMEDMTEPKLLVF